MLLKNLAWRFFEADYLMTNFTGTLVSPKGRQNNFRIGTGAVLRWGYPPAPPKPNHPPVASCSATPTSVYQGSTDPVTIHVAATDADNDPLTYSYTCYRRNRRWHRRRCALESRRTGDWFLHGERQG